MRSVVGIELFLCGLDDDGQGTQLTRTERQRIELIQRGDRRACQSFVVQYMPSLYAFFQGMGLSATVSEDLAQETFLELWKSFGTFRGESSLKTWVFMIGRRVGWRHFKRRTHGETALEPEEEVEIAEGHPELQDELLWRREQRALLEEGIHLLDARFREILLLHYMEDLSLREVAEILGVAEGTVKSRLHRALQRLRESIEIQWK